MHKLSKLAWPFVAFAFCILVSISLITRAAVEAQFTLSTDSRFPRWMSLPPGKSRDDVTIVLTYLTPSKEGTDAILQMQDAKGTVLESVQLNACWHPIMRTKRNKYGGLDPDSYPFYRYIEKDGQIEVIEHRRMEPVFRVSDDQKLKNQASAAERCNKS